MKTSLIITVLNEEKTINLLLNSVLTQIVLPNEVIICDGGSSDKTAGIIKENIALFSSKNIRLRLLTGSSNRSMGRNNAIRKAKYEIILCTDAGCILDKYWVKNMISCFQNNQGYADVVAGYYRGKAVNIFERCLVPYVLVMDDKVSEHNFLPSARSIAFTKKIWEKAAGFPEALAYSEDLFFARKLKKLNAKIKLCKDAIVYWLPRKNFIESFRMFFNFAYGDIRASIFRPKVFFIFIRYIIGIALLIYALRTYNLYISSLLIVFLVLYITWAIIKNYKYVSHWKALIYLPLLQFTSDIAVIAGSGYGLISKLHKTG